MIFDGRKLKFGILKIAPVPNLYPESQVSMSYIEASAPAYNMSGTIGGELTHTPLKLWVVLNIKV